MASLEITSMIGCPLKCTFCPQDTLREAYSGVKYLNYVDFVHMLKKVPIHVRIDFSGMAEFWANPEAYKIFVHVLESGYRFNFFSTLYGVDKNLANLIIAQMRANISRLNKVVIHLPDNEGNMPGWRNKNEYLDALKIFIDWKNTGEFSNFEIMTMSKYGKPHQEIAHIVPFLKPWKGHTRAGNIALDDTYKTAEYRDLMTEERSSVISCSYTPFYDSNVLLPNGDVVLCCMDYGKKHVLGNLLTDDYYALFSSGEMGNIVSSNLNPSSKYSLCKECISAAKYKSGNDSEWEPIHFNFTNRRREVANRYMKYLKLKFKSMLG